MLVRVLFFGVLRDMIGTGAETVELPEGASLDVLWARYAERFPPFAAFRKHVRAAINRDFAEDAAALHTGDEVAFLPPVSGGSESGMVALTDSIIDTRALVRMVEGSANGALVVFEGVVRDNTRGRATVHLEYDCYRDMALSMMEELTADIQTRHAISRLAMVHRLGRVEIGEASVVIAVSAPHRGAAFDACREAINRLKQSVPIWKKEFFADGAEWVEGDWGNDAAGR